MFPFSNRCKIVDCDKSQPVYEETFLNYTLPRDENGKLMKCKMFEKSTNKSHSISVHGLNNESEKCLPTSFSNVSIPCEAGYVYDRSLFQSTAVMEVCGEVLKI